jgi:hypothetical protein
MRFIGELKYGKYADNFEQIHPDVIERYSNEGMLNFLHLEIILDNLLV